LSSALGVWLQFLVCLLLIGFAGVKLSRYGDVIAEKTGMGGTWIGLVLMASVTSLPELITGISSVTLAHVPNIAVGNILGACVMNLFMIVVLDFLHRGESVYTRASHGHILAAGFGVVLLAFVGFNLLLGSKADTVALGHVGLYTPVIVLLYLISMRTLFRYEEQQRGAYVEERAARYPDVSLRQAAIRYAAAAVVVIGAALWLPFVAEGLAHAMGWHGSFVGTIFVALATTTPEMVVTVFALRLGALDMAIANLFGSNLFNLALLAIDDLLYLPGPLLSHVNPVHAVSAFSAIAMTGAAIVGLFYRTPGRLFRTVGWASLFLFSIYLLNSYVLYLHGD
jgi:cation:H+ antiporter